MKRISIRNATHMVEWFDDGHGMIQAKAFRKNHPEFKGRHIRHITQLNPSQVPCGDIVEWSWNH